MIEPPVPHDETRRLRALQALRILDTEAEERFDRVTRMATRLFQVPTAIFSLVDANRQWFKSRQGLDACETSRAISFCGHAILSRDTFVIENALADARFADNPLVTGEPHIRFYAGHPICGADGDRIGTLCLIDRTARTFTAEDREMLGELARMIEAELNSMKLATTDDLTLLPNRRGFHQIAARVLGLCRRFGRPAHVALFDLDDFKPINDRFGHAEGDRVLGDFATILLKTFRDSDVVARLGGDEFCALLSGADRAGLARCLDRLQAAVDELNESRPARLAFTVGTVAYDPARHESIDELLQAADARMYEAKADKKSRRPDAGRSAPRSAGTAHA